MKTLTKDGAYHFMKPLQCSFCGQEPEITKYKLQGVMVWNVACENDDCLVDVETADFESVNDAIKA